MPFGHKPKRHEISIDTEQAVTTYLAKNGLESVYVCVNEYDPAGEWRRLKANQRISPVWRYSFGVLSLAGYTLFPEPVVCANRYNAFTNRLSVNVDEPLDILYAAACAKDVSTQPMPGTYAVISFVPGLSIISGIRATNEVVCYSRDQSDWEIEREAYRRLYPRIGMESSTMAILLLPVWWEGALVGLGGSAIGHLAGRYVESQRQLERDDAKEQTDQIANEPGHESHSDSTVSDSHFPQLTSEREENRQVSGP